LIEKGWLERVPRIKPSGERDTTVYLLKDPPKDNGMQAGSGG
jgi:hypothetical protein